MVRSGLRYLVFVGVLAVGLASAGATGSPGSADTYYGVSGAADGGRLFVEDAAALPDGSVLVVGISYTTSPGFYALHKFDPYGDLDTDFGTNGLAPVFGSPPASENWAGTVAVGPDGRIFVGGVRTYTTQVTSGKGKKTTTTNHDVTTGSLLALDADGSVDADFGVNGYLDTGWSVPWNLAFRGTSSSYEVVMAYGVQVQTEVAGTGKGKKGGTQTIDTSAIALHAVDGFTGADATAFGDDGVMVDDLSTTTFDRPRGVRIDGLGRIVVLTSSEENQSDARDMIITRYSSTGVLDTAFGTNGRLSVGSVGGGDYPNNFLAIDGDGKRILLAARSPTTSGLYETVVVRYTESGSAIDTTFDVPEIPDTSDPTEYDTWPEDLHVDANGKVCVTIWYGVDNTDLTIVRCNADGTRDTSFGPNADGIAEILDLSDEEWPRATVIDASGGLIVVGQSSYPIKDVQPYYEAVLVRWDG